MSTRGGQDPRSANFAAVLSAAQLGEPWASATLWVEFAPAITAFLRARGSREPEDLTSETFIAVLESLPQFVGGESQFRSFIFSVAYRRLVDEFRSRTRRGVDAEWSVENDPRSSPSAEQEAITRVGDSSALSLINSLPNDQRDVMALRIIGDLSVDQIAAVLEKRPGAVKALQRRALERLRKKFSESRTPHGLSGDSKE